MVVELSFGDVRTRAVARSYQRLASTPNLRWASRLFRASSLCAGHRDVDAGTCPGHLGFSAGSDGPGKLIAVPSGARPSVRGGGRIGAVADGEDEEAVA